MERVWLVSPEIFELRATLPQHRQAEVVAVPDLDYLEKVLEAGERVVLLAHLPVLQAAKKRFPRMLASGLLPPEHSAERILLAARAVLTEAKLQHDLEAAENIPWAGAGSGQFDDPSIELLGASILELAGARDMTAIEHTIQKACSPLASIREVRVFAHPETASSRVIGLYRLAVPVQFQGELKAHVYVRFEGDVDQATVDKVGEALLNLSDALALAVERNSLIMKAEETKAVWEASFDAVEDPVAILDASFHVIRGNRAYGRVTNTPLVKLQSKAPQVVPLADLQAIPAGESSEWNAEYAGRFYRVFFDTIQDPLGIGRFVLRLHDVNDERTLTEKIIAKEQVAELGILVGSVAHEINNPIGGILAIGQILMKDIPAGSPLYSDIENIVVSAERCRKIIQTMLSLVRKSDEEKGECRISECVQSALELLGGELKRFQVRLLVTLPDPTKELKVFGNRNRLLQVFFHLFQQALLAIAEKKAKQEFDAYLSVSFILGFENMEVQVEDNGDTTKHEYEIQGSVAFTVAKMILDEHEVGYSFQKKEGRNSHRLIFSALSSTAS